MNQPWSLGPFSVCTFDPGICTLEYCVVPKGSGMQRLGGPGYPEAQRIEIRQNTPLLQAHSSLWNFLGALNCPHLDRAGREISGAPSGGLLDSGTGYA